MIRVALSLLLVLSPISAAAQTAGFTPSDLERAASSLRQGSDRDLRTARAIYAQTETLRAALLLNPDAAMYALSPGEREILSGAFGPDDGRLSARIGWFARGATVRVAPGDALGTAGLYNPILDAWLVVRWNVLGGVLRLTDAALADGAVMRPQGEAATWIGAGAGDPAALAGQRDAASARFDEAFSQYGPDALFVALANPAAARRQEVWARTDRWLAGLAAWGASHERARRVERVHEALVEGPMSASGRRMGLPRALDAMPPRLRATMAPIAAWSTPESEHLLFMSPLSGSRALLMTLNGSGAAGFEALDLSAATSLGAQP
ncbi:MAG: hypothetical protein JNJ63_00450 [Hyphomonadaceae bacterium]|nr:hypothetical protein [Hyphomonadaceae bacterium]